MGLTIFFGLCIVADPPSFITEGPTLHYVLLGDNVSLVCGTGLDSNPQATITWTAPDGNTIVDNARYYLENGPEVIQLNISSTIMSDAGVWRCDVTVNSEAHELSGGKLTPQNDTLIGSVNVTIQLIIIGAIMIIIPTDSINFYVNNFSIVIVPPGQPSIPTIESSGATWAFISWTGPLVAVSPISYYEITIQAVDSGEIVILTTTTNTTNFNVTSLLTGTSHELAVVAISEDGNITARSLESASVVIIVTGMYVLALSVHSILIFINYKLCFILL